MIPALPEASMAPFLDRNELFRPPKEQVLGSDERVQIALDASPLADNKSVHDRFGIQGALIATIAAGGKHFIILDTRNTENNRDFLVIDETFSLEKNTGYKGVVEGTPLTIGRSHHNDRFKYPGTVSRKQFQVTYANGQLFLQNLVPMNETAITARLETIQAPSRSRIPIDERTIKVIDRVGKEENNSPESPYGYYKGYPILGRKSTSVCGGVYLGGSAREAVIVDEDSPTLRRGYRDATANLRHLFENGSTVPLGTILNEIMHQVQVIMPFDETKTDLICQPYYGDQLVGLSAFVEEHAGVCRHQALFAGYCIEQLINAGYMPGTVGVERNTSPNGGTHGWAVYRTGSEESAEIFVIDPTQSFVGTKQEAARRGGWSYELPASPHSSRGGRRYGRSILKWLGLSPR